MVNLGRIKVAQNLRDMFVRSFFHRFDFDNQLVVNKQIRIKNPKKLAILIENLGLMLLLNRNPLLPQTMRQRSFINFFHVPGAEILVNFVSGLPHHIAQLENVDFFHDLIF